MAKVALRPDLKTAGGEVSDILFNGRYVGSFTLVYREKDRISGAIQLEKPSLSNKDKKQVVKYMQSHVQSLIDALQVENCEVFVTYSAYDHFIVTEPATNANQHKDFNSYDVIDDDLEYDVVEDDIYFDEDDISDRDILEMETPQVDEIDANFYRNPAYYELVIVGEGRNRIEYHIYDKEQEWIAEAFMKISGSDVTGELNWMFQPTEEEIEQGTDLIVSDFNEDEIDTFVIHHHFEGEIIETIELTHEALLDDAETGEVYALEDDYSIVLVRDDGDMLTYEIYQQSRGGLPIGTATVDISYRRLTGFIDFRDPGSAEDVEYISTQLLRELDKERDYDAVSLTMLVDNEPFDEIIFESEQVH